MCVLVTVVILGFGLVRPLWEGTGALVPAIGTGITEGAAQASDPVSAPMAEPPVAVVAGTVAYLINNSGACPESLDAINGQIMTPAGNVNMPTGATFIFLNSGTSCGFAIEATDGSRASWDSTSGLVTTQ